MTRTTPPCPFQSDVPLSQVGYYAIGGEAAWVATPRTVREVADLLSWCRMRELPVIVSGKGSNMLFSDEAFPGVVMTTSSLNRMFRVSERLFFAEAGVENTEVASRVFEEGRGGAEWLFRLPGMIGATVRMNGRCYGREVSEVTVGVVTVTLDGTVRWRSKEEVFHGYKSTSLMRGQEIVVGVLLEFPEKRSRQEIRELMDEYERDRHARHQFDYPSCGSTFKNSYAAGRPSGTIFESLGFKGRTLGGAKVSEHHANFIFNTGGARAVDVLRLAADMRRAAREEAGAELELEVQCAGLFEAGLLEACGVEAVPEPSRPGFAWAGLMRPEPEASASFPRVLMQGMLFDYAGLDSRFPPNLTVEVVQLSPIEEARRHPEAPFLRWVTLDEGGSAFPLRPASPAGAFVDRLWESGVSELFLGSADGYLEFEATPEGQWLAIRFDGPRVRSAGHEHPAPSFWSGAVRTFSGSSGFGMELSWALVEPFIREGGLPLQCCASLGDGRYGLFPWWNDAGVPDFHQPGRYCPVRPA